MMQALLTITTVTISVTVLWLRSYRNLCRLHLCNYYCMSVWQRQDVWIIFVWILHAVKFVKSNWWILISNVLHAHALSLHYNTMYLLFTGLNRSNTTQNHALITANWVYKQLHLTMLNFPSCAKIRYLSVNWSN